MKGDKNFRLGKNQQKILLTLLTGVNLGFTRSPGMYYRILGDFKKGWSDINKGTFERAIDGLKKSKLISFTQYEDGNYQATLTEFGKNRAAEFEFKKIKIKKPKKWDKKWRIVIFDIPEKNRRARDALRALLKRLEFMELQKSVFIYPYECEKNIGFLVNFFNIHKHVRFIKAEYIDNAKDVKNNFGLN
ncbi:hypothetical protein KAI92_02300 [Candidatus Parcubacteria bacterium]|nr:hypothetical protein [Candidatus Parcubacteria bacterium]